MIIGLYDIDMWNTGKSMPNLELMKVYNYYYKKNHRVLMMKPKEDELKYAKIFYFKEKLNTQIPNSLVLNEDKKQIIGYGFYGKTPKLKPEIHSMQPSYDPYDIYSYKLKVPKGYDTLKKSSLIRVETEDFINFKNNINKVYVADSNFLYSNGAEDFLKENKNNHSFLFYHNLIAKDEETYNTFIRYSILFDRRILIDFDFN